MRFWPHRLTLVLGLPMLAAGCGADPAAQEPVKVKPGLYAATLGGRAFSAFYTAAPKELDKKVCVYPEDVETFPQMYARKYLSMGESCGGDLAERVGNRISGKVSCPFEPNGKIGGRLVTRFEGDVAEESVVVRAVTKVEDLQGPPEAIDELKASPLAEEGVELMLKITRVGDCEA